MKSHTEYLSLNLPERRAFVNITPPVAATVDKSGVREVVVAITNAKLDFGPWEQIFYGEFDVRRKKRVLIKGIGE